MVTKSKPKREVPRFACGCGAMIAQRGQQMHEMSKAHQAWLATQAEEEVVPVAAPMPASLQQALDAAKRGDDPIVIAKMVRSYFNSQGWPNEKHQGTVADFLAEHGIPARYLPRHVDPDEFREYCNNWQAMLQSCGWGTDGWSLEVFNTRWPAFWAELVRQRAAQGQSVSAGVA